MLSYLLHRFRFRAGDRLFESATLGLIFIFLNSSRNLHPIDINVQVLLSSCCVYGSKWRNDLGPGFNLVRGGFWVQFDMFKKN